MRLSASLPLLLGYVRRLPLETYCCTTVEQTEGRLVQPPLPDGVASELSLEVRSAGNKGMGAFSTEAAAPNTWVCSYVGELVSLAETEARYTDEEPEYLFMLTADLYLDAQVRCHARQLAVYPIQLPH